MTYVAAAAIGIGAWNGYDAYTKQQKLSAVVQELHVTTNNAAKVQQQLQTTTESLTKAQQKLEVIAADEQKAETDLTVALSRGKNIVNGVLPAGYQEGTVVVQGGNTPFGPLQVSFQGPLSAQVKDVSVGVVLFPDKKVTVQNLYVTTLTRQAVQNEPSIAVSAGTLKLPQDIRQKLYEQLQNAAMLDPPKDPSGNEISFSLLAKDDSYALVAAEPKYNAAVEQTASGLQKKYGLIVLASGKGAEKNKEVKKSESQKEESKTLDTLLYVTNETFEKDVLKAEKPGRVDFYADWCGPCREMAPVYEELSKEYVGKVMFAKLDIKTFNHPRAQEYAINGIPALLLFHKGKEMTRSVGYKEKVQLKKFLDDALTRMQK